MNIFEHCRTNKDQGNIGEACAIYELTKRGYCISKPLSENQKYDLIVEKDGVLYRVEVKTSKRILKNGTHEVTLSGSSNNRVRPKRIMREKNKCDFYFILLSNNSFYLIPDNEIDAKTSIVIGEKYEKYKL